MFFQGLSERDVAEAGIIFATMGRILLGCVHQGRSGMHVPKPRPEDS